MLGCLSPQPDKPQGSGGAMNGQSLPTANKLADKLTEPEKKPAAAQLVQKTFVFLHFLT